MSIPMSPELRRIVRWLRAYHPCPKPLRVVLSKRLHNRDNGEMLYDQGRVLIRIRPDLPQIELRETLLHEWAHALTCFDQEGARSHLEHDSIYTTTYTRLVDDFKATFPGLPLRVDKTRR